LLELAGIQKGWRAVLIGCADLQLLRSLSDGVGGDGEVYAVDNDEEVISKVKASGLPNVRPLYSRLVERIVHLPSNYFHLAIVAYRLEDAMQRRNMLTEVNRLLIVKGRAIIIAYLKGFFRRRGISEKEFNELLARSPLKELDRRKSGGVVVVLLERVTPPAVG
jgi:ubiquinone/menaquinone biosynthesis C-methylase UbiE